MAKERRVLFEYEYMADKERERYQLFACAVFRRALVDAFYDEREKSRLGKGSSDALRWLMYKSPSAKPKIHSADWWADTFDLWPLLKAIRENIDEILHRSRSGVEFWSYCNDKRNGAAS